MKKSLYILSLVILIWTGSKIDWNPKKTVGCPYCDKSIFESQVVHQGDYVSVIATHKPAALGHLLIIPNRHVVTFDGLSESEIQEIGQLVGQVHQKYLTALRASDYVLLQKNGPTAGQSVPHVHVHIMPRSNTVSMLSFVIRLFVRPILKPMDSYEMEQYKKIFEF